MQGLLTGLQENALYKAFATTDIQHRPAATPTNVCLFRNGAFFCIIRLDEALSPLLSKMR